MRVVIFENRLMHKCQINCYNNIYHNLYSINKDIIYCYRCSLKIPSFLTLGFNIYKTSFYIDADSNDLSIGEASIITPGTNKNFPHLYDELERLTAISLDFQGF